MTLRKWLSALYSHKTYKYMLYMGEEFFTEISLEDLLSKYGNHSKFIAQVGQGIIWITLKKPWRH